MAARGVIRRAFVAAGAGISPGHIGFGPGLVQEYQAAGVEVADFVQPLLALSRYVFSLLLART